MAAATPRYAWVLSGRHPSPPVDADPGPRTEYQVFLQHFGGTLISCTNLDEPVPWAVKLVQHARRPRISLASLIQSRASQFDAIIASGEDIGVLIALLSLTGTSRVPIHMMFHGHHLASSRLRFLAPVLRRLSHVHFHCLSQSLKKQTQDILGIPAERCHATGYGIDTDYFTDTDHFTDTGVANATLIASAGAANRDYTTLAAAARDLPVTVCIAADSTWVSPLQEEEARHWPSNVMARSYGTYARLRDLYDQARFVVVPLHPARYACGYAVIAEAMAMGRAVIATRTESPPDFLQPGVTGLFVETHDVEGLRHEICRLLDHPAEADRIGRNARALMVKTHSLEHYCDRLERIVAGTVRQRRAA